MELNASRALFAKELRVSLSQLYDPGRLRRSLLILLFGLDEKANAVDHLRRLLVDGIDNIRPGATVPLNAHAWRYFKILQSRFIKQNTQRVVALELGLSTRQLRRAEATAIQVLADHMWTQRDLGSQSARAQPLTEKPGQFTPAQTEMLRARSHLDKSGNTTSDEAVAICALISKVYRWRKEFDGLRTDQDRQLKLLELENARLRSTVADLSQDNTLMWQTAAGDKTGPGQQPPAAARPTGHTTPGVTAGRRH